MFCSRDLTLFLAILASCSPRTVWTDAAGIRDIHPQDHLRADNVAPDLQPECPPAAATLSEIAATPRADTNLELLALRLSNTVTATQGIYDRVVADVTAIRMLRPEVADIPYRALHDGKTLSFSVDTLTAMAIRDGKYSAWDCLNAAYQVTKLDANVGSLKPPTPPLHYVGLTLKGIYKLERVAEEYAVLLANGTVNPNYPGGDGSTICITRNDTLWHYVLSRGLGDCPAGCTQHVAFYFTTLPGSVATFHDSWDSDTDIPMPAWWLTYGPPNGKAAACPNKPYP